MSPLALRTTRALMHEMESMDFKDAPRRAAQAISQVSGTEDRREARRAFREKRKPVWTVH